MQIVIDVDDKTYSTLFPKELTEMSSKKTLYWLLKLHSAVCKGTILPKGHGRLVDENDLVKDFSTFQDAFVINVAHGFELRVVCTAPTIVEADKEAEDG